MAINLHEWRILCSKIYNNKQHTEKIDEIFEFYDADQNERLVQYYIFIYILCVGYIRIL